MESDVCNTDTGPGEETGNGSEALEPFEGHVGSRRAAQVSQERDRGGDTDTPIRNTPATILDTIFNLSHALIRTSSNTSAKILVPGRSVQEHTDIDFRCKERR